MAVMAQDLLKMIFVGSVEEWGQYHE